MKNAMDHERCSELLLPLLRGELDDSARNDVEVHLASCDECSGEKAALERVLAVEITGLTDSERRTLREEVAGRLQTPGSTRDVIPARRPSRFRRALPALGAVAVLALGAVFAANLIDRGTGGDESAGRGGDAGGGGGPALLEEGQAPEAAPDAAEGGGRSVPYFKRGTEKLNATRLDRIARHEAAFGFLAGTESQKAKDLRTALTTELSDQAPPDARDQVRACIESVTGSQGSVLPAYGTKAEYKGKEALLLGFVSGTDSGPLNRYMLWLWPKGSCDVPLDYLSGPIKK